ncbi:aldehyde dehydrogenase family protein [Streptosporangium sp. NBC_01810]|uniref:aldehyde dehydrogenase family protein n=1 Tax=Streptosporangium sp. NBC_01810 TaxID=2975951 RepID=UPI002DDA7C30|nr:aldehyde dehydrogenase family protein [Streptosporangium sp. NBC_01810]WSA28573.1 aldehyde dehydrogenase family protein [Streptosporangium sp. NBC_01810]
MSGQRALQHWIGGAEAAGDGQERIDVVNPATNAVIADAPAGTAADVDRAVAAAQRALPQWSAVPASERAAAIARIADGIKGTIDSFASTVTSEMGSPISYAKVMQAELPSQVVSSFAAVADGFTWEEELGNALVVREPIGVVGAITPWNAPLYQTVAKVAPALLAGCTVVLKPSVATPLTAALFAEVTAAAGIPAGVFNVVYGAGSVVGEAIAGHQGIDMVSFTGSTGAGKQVSIAATNTVKRVALELGGKSANVILDDADLQRAVDIGLEFAWLNGGQTCAAWTRMLVPAHRHDEIVELAVAAAASYGVGDPTDPATRIGPMSSTAQQGRVSRYIERGIADGATVAFGGSGPVEGLEHGAYVRPTIFANVAPDAVIAQEEIFGPVLSVIPYADEDEAVAIANNSIYGLGGAVFGEPDHALAVAKRMRTGQVIVNGGEFNLTAPFGGYKQSGNGRELGRTGVEEFLELKAIHR